MKLKSFITKTLAVSAIATMAINCHPDKVEEDVLLAALVSSQIRGLGAGNCAVSLNLGTLYSGAIIQTAANTATIFTADEFAQANGKTFSELGYATYAAVPYNLKYDAFIKGGGTYTSDSRTTDINTARLETLKNAYLGAAAAACSANGGATANAAATGFRSGSAAVSGSLSASEITELTTYIAANPIGGQTSFAVIEAGVITAACGTFQTNVGGAANVASLAGAYQARQAFANGTAILACGRIPKSSCSLGGISSPNRAAHIASKEKAYGDVANNTDCRKPDADFMNRVKTNLFTGLPRGTQVLGTISSPDVEIGRITEGGTAPNNQVFAEKAYPTSSALSAISTNFNVAFPLTTGQTAQASSSIPYYGASNINFAVVDSCESIGFNGFGPINTAATTSAALTNRRTLTSVKEILYAFSAENTAASIYASTRGAVQNTFDAAGNDAIACNNSFRSKLSIPLAIGGGKLSALDSAISGDGAATSNLSLCVYGGTSTGRTTSISLLVGGVASLTGLESCSTLNAAGAAKFGDAGLQTLANFPNNE